MTSALCGARYRHNRAITCGKQPGHLNVDPLHKMTPEAPATLEWFDYDTADREPVTVDAIRDPSKPGLRTEEDVAAAPRPLGWLFNKGAQTHA